MFTTLTYLLTFMFFLLWLAGRKSRRSVETEDRRHGWILSLGFLEGAIKWEFRALLVASVACIVNTASAAINSRRLEKASLVVGFFTIIPIAVSDLFASIQLTLVFLRPVLQALKMAKGIVQNHSWSKMQKTKWSALSGARLPPFPPSRCIRCTLISSS